MRRSPGSTHHPSRAPAGPLGGLPVPSARLHAAAISQRPPLQPGHTRTSGGSKYRPNILIIMGDDVGWFNLSAYNRGMMGYWTPHIDRIAREGVLFTDYYGQQSCTAGRA